MPGQSIGILDMAPQVFHLEPAQIPGGRPCREPRREFTRFRLVRLQRQQRGQGTCEVPLAHAPQVAQEPACSVALHLVRLEREHLRHKPDRRREEDAAADEARTGTMGIARLSTRPALTRRASCRLTVCRDFRHRFATSVCWRQQQGSRSPRFQSLGRGSWAIVVNDRISVSVSPNIAFATPWNRRMKPSRSMPSGRVGNGSDAAGCASCRPL